MITIQLSFTGSEAVTMLKKHYTDTYQQKIDNGVAFLTSLKKLFNCSLADAYQKSMDLDHAPSKKIEIVAAYYLMSKQANLAKQITNLQNLEIAYKDQMQALETAKFSNADKRELHKHYQMKLKNIKLEIDAYLDQFPVFDAQTINEPVLMTQTV